MRVLLLGENGQLGWELRRSLATLGLITALDYPQIDLTKLEQARRVIKRIKPQVIINATAYTSVNGAESEPEVALAINRDAPSIIAEEAKALGAAFIHYSTDYVFDGKKSEPYVETDLPNPVNTYGQSKLAGEHEITNIGGTYLILRTSWLYSLRGETFVNKVLKWSRQYETLRIVEDQVGSPTWCRMLAEATAQVLVMGGVELVGWLAERRGLYHLAGEGYVSRYEWAQEILRYNPNPQEQVTRHVLPSLTSEFPTPAQRPLFSALNCDRFYKTFGICLPDWRDALRLALDYPDTGS
jgi:dTDP-4-dehydrorhamnose reductase